jgi:F-type H+-transporting ATPase subunit delta
MAQAPTLKLHGISGRYATSLYMVAQKAGALADVQGELTSMAANLKDSVELKALFEDPSIKIAQQKSALAAVLGAGGFTPTTQNFFSMFGRTPTSMSCSGVSLSHTAFVCTHSRCRRK